MGTELLGQLLGQAAKVAARVMVARRVNTRRPGVLALPIGRLPVGALTFGGLPVAAVSWAIAPVVWATATGSGTVLPRTAVP